MNPKSPLLALFLASMKDPDTRAQTLAETGDPNNLTRHAIVPMDGQIAFAFDTVDGPKQGGSELMDVAILPDEAMIVTAQRYTDDIKPLLTDGSTDDIGQAIYAKYESTGGVKLSALGDPELDGKSGVFFYDKNTDGKYVVKGVGKEMQGVTIDGGMALVYKDGMVAKMNTVDLLDVLRRDAFSEITDLAAATAQIGEHAKMARTATIEIGGENKKVWAFVQKDGDQNTITFLDHDTLAMIGMKKFDGDYATPSFDGRDMVLVGRKIEEGGETFSIARHDIDGFTADASTPA